MQQWVQRSDLIICKRGMIQRKLLKYTVIKMKIDSLGYFQITLSFKFMAIIT
jgi:hypothetical protein